MRREKVLAIDEAALVEALECKNYVGRVESCLLLPETSLQQVKEDLATYEKLFMAQRRIPLQYSRTRKSRRAVWKA